MFAHNDEIHWHMNFVLLVTPRGWLSGWAVWDFKYASQGLRVETH